MFKDFIYLRDKPLACGWGGVEVEGKGKADCTECRAGHRPSRDPEIVT